MTSGTQAPVVGLAVAIFWIGSIGCATTPVYQGFDCTPSDAAWPLEGWECRGGYSEIQLDEEVHQVRYEGAASPAQNQDFALLRAAELTLERGYGDFVVMRGGSGHETPADPITYTPPEVSCDANGKHCVTLGGSWIGGGSYAVSTASYTLTIRLIRKRPRGEGPVIHDAVSVAQDLRLKYHLGRAPTVAASPAD
jgi:hypothetical protein